MKIRRFNENNQELDLATLISSPAVSDSLHEFLLHFILIMNLNFYYE